MKLIFRTMVVLLVLCLALPLGVAQAAAPPYMPQVFYGEVTIGDIPAPDGTTVSAEIEDFEYASTTTFTEDGEEGKYLLEVPGEDPTEPGKQGGEPGDTVVLKVSRMLAATADFEQGMFTELDLAIGALVDLTDLDAAILSAEALTEANYTADSWAGVATALADALVVQANAAATQAEVDAATTALTEAMDALVFAGQADLDTAVAAAGALTEADYTAGSWADLVTALALPETTNAEVVAKTTAINDAIGALVFAGQADLDAAVAAAAALTEADYTAGSWADLVTALALPETTNDEVVAKTAAINDAIAALVVGDATPPTIEYACVIYYYGAESVRLGDPFEVAAVVTDDTAVALVVVDTPFGTLQLVGEEYEGVTVYQLVTEVPEDTSYGTHPLTVRAWDAAGNTDNWSLELKVVPTLTAYNIELADGWNLISLPLIHDDAATGTVLDGLSFFGEDLARAVLAEEDVDSIMPAIEKVWHYDAVGEYGTAEPWLYFEPATGLGDLTEMVDGKGYWVVVDAVSVEEASLTTILTVYGVEMVSGSTLPPTYAVVEGWNLIGFKEASSMNFSQYLSAVDGKYARIYLYWAPLQRFYLVGEGGLTYMQPGAGYWIYMTDAGYIVP